MKNYRKEFPSDPDMLPQIDSFILDIAKDLNLSKEKLNGLSLSVAEAASNAIIHGNKCDRDKKLVIDIIVNQNQIIVKFKDQGSGFDPSHVPDPTETENILKESGRGIHIMKSYLDDLKFNFTPNGTEVSLIISLD